MLKCTSEIATEDLTEKDKPTKKETCSDVEVDEKTLFYSSCLTYKYDCG